jgi:radical SAM protein with 4Fe4S-binding SPASM domain
MLHIGGLMAGSVSLIVKTTKNCNANCGHCSSYVREKEIMTLENLKKSFRFLKENAITDPSYLEIIWHGGEPMLMKPSYYEEASDILEEIFPKTQIIHSLQTNLLLYSSEWKRLFTDVFQWRISSSYDFFSSFRQISHGNYYHQWLKSVKKFQDDSGSTLQVIVVLNKENYKKVLEICKIALELKIGIKLNTLYPVGRGAGLAHLMLSPEEYFSALSEAFAFWKANKSFRFYQAEIFSSGELSKLPCPYTNRCFGFIYALEPNGDVYNCAECADINLHRYANAISGEVCFSGLTSMKVAEIDIPNECVDCGICGGGCKKERFLFRGTLAGKTPYCYTWKEFYKLGNKGG